jgi:hypothetical protein
MIRKLRLLPVAGFAPYRVPMQVDDAGMLHRWSRFGGTFVEAEQKLTDQVTGHA